MIWVEIVIGAVALMLIGSVGFLVVRERRRAPDRAPDHLADRRRELIERRREAQVQADTWMRP